ncbi:MAG: hypothetical protein WBH99_08135 [Azovibrio sp.]|uniref:hypothetical protein n=1 Tax=Azovibrio sp. TaxID=1872673 RepID=UPI003C7457A8
MRFLIPFPRLSLIGLTLLLSACAGLPDRATEGELQQRLGTPAMHWEAADGRLQLAYPTGPMGFATWMVWLGPDRRLEKLENVLDTAHFARIQPGQSQAEVLSILGPPIPSRTVYYEARDELVWEWRYCDDWAEPARFHVLFDGRTKTVRSTLSLTESQSQLFIQFREYCSRPRRP